MSNGHSEQLDGRAAVEPEILHPTPVADNNDVNPLNSNERGPAEEPIGLPLNERTRPPFNPKEWCRIGCLNVNTMHRTGRTAIVAEEIRRYKLEIAGLSETRWHGKGKTRVDGITFIYAGKEEGVHERGVAIALGQSAEKMLERYECINERIVWCRLKGKYVNVTIVQVYAPTEEKTDEEKEDFYIRLKEVIRSVKQHDMLLLMGDFNAKVGQDDGIWRDIMGVFGVGTRNNNGLRLLEMCAEHRLCVTNTIFNHKIEHKATWNSPDGATRNLIDYVIVNRARRSSVLDTRVYRGCKVPSDHNLVVSKLRIKLKAHQKQMTNRKYDVDRLKTEEVRREYETSIGSRFTALADREDMDAEQIWTNFKTATKEVAKEVLGFKRRQHKPWITERSRVLSEKQRRLRVEADDETDLERKACLRAERRTTLHELHSSLKDDENKFWEEKANELEEAGQRGESHAMFAAVKMLKNMGDGQSRSSSMGIRNEDGIVVNSEKEKLTVFSRYFEKLYNPPMNADREILRDFETTSPEQEERIQITEEEVERAIKSTHSRRSAGVCEVSPELIKYGGAEMVGGLTKVFNVVIENGRVPAEWKKAIIVPIFKNKGSKLDCANYRGISLTSVPSKVFLRVLLNRVKPIIEERLREEQAGFRGARSTVDQIFALRQVVEKRWEHAMPVYCAFMDLEKAYDSVWREGMWQIAKHYGVPSQIVEMLREYYDGSTSCVRMDGGEGDWFPINTGLRQGCVMSPSLFNIYMDAMMRKVIDGAPGGVTVGNERVTDLDFADDVALMADTWMVLVGMVMSMEQVTQRFGINISAKKSEILYIGRGEGNVRTEDLQLRGQALKQVEEFIYLGSVFASDGRIIQDIERRRAGATRTFGTLRRRLWGRREVSLKVKMKVFNATVLPVLLYGATTWPLTQTEERRLDAFEMRMLRNIAGVRWEDMVRNVDIRERLRQPPVSLKLRRARMKWFGHVERMGEEREVKRVMRAQMQGRRPRGRPRTRWKDVIRRDLETSGLSLEEAAAEAQDRDGWRQIVLASCVYNAAGS